MLDIKGKAQGGGVGGSSRKKGNVTLEVSRDVHFFVRFSGSKRRILDRSYTVSPNLADVFPTSRLDADYLS